MAGGFVFNKFILIVFLYNAIKKTRIFRITIINLITIIFPFLLEKGKTAHI